jgi:hypothetical protein
VARVLVDHGMDIRTRQAGLLAVVNGSSMLNRGLAGGLRQRWT